MNYHKLRFVIIWLFLFSILTYFFYSTEYKQYKLENYQSYKRILSQKKSVVQGIKKDEPFPNYDAKVKLCELISLEYIGQVKKLLKSKSWKKKIKMEPNVFGKSSGLIIGKKNKKFLLKHGNDFESFFGKKWYKRLFLALKTKGSYFEGMIERIYPYAVSHEEFVKRKDMFTILYKNGDFILFLHTETNDKSIFYMLHLDKIDHTQMMLETNKLFISSNSNLSTSKKGNTFSLNQEVISDNGEEIGLNYDLTYPSYIQWLLTNYYLLIVGFITILYLQFTGGYRIYSVGIEYALFIVTLAFTMTLNYINFNIFHYWRINTLRADTFIIQKQWQAKSNKIDDNFVKFKKELSNTIKNALQQGSMEQLSFDYQDWFIFDVNDELECTVYPKETKLLSSIIIKGLSKEVIRLNTVKYKTSSGVEDLKNLDLKTKNVITNALQRRNKHLVYRKAKQIVENSSEVFNKWDDYKDGYYIFWSKLKDWNHLNEFALVMIPIPSMIESYLQSNYMKNRSVMIRSKISKGIIYPKEKYTLPLFDLQKQWLQTQNSGNLASEFHRLSKDYTSLFVASEAFDNHHFFFYEALDNLESKISAVKTWYFYLQVILWICALSLSYYLRQILITPLNDARLLLTKIKDKSKDCVIPIYFPKNLGKINQSINRLHQRFRREIGYDNTIDSSLAYIVENFNNDIEYDCISLTILGMENESSLYEIASKYSAYFYSLRKNQHTLLFFEKVHGNYIQNGLQTAIELLRIHKKAKFLIRKEKRVYHCAKYEFKSIICMFPTREVNSPIQQVAGTILIDTFSCNELKYNYEFIENCDNYYEFRDKVS
ncbi:MAG: hypothetical protein KC646_04725 [Candidatus Cloacimonetes bacterium]|nr:hypothetical protein [Candidatus Cloacimonadota bacterium]